METAEVLDGEVEQHTELVTAASVAVTTPVKAGDLVERMNTIREAMERAMQKDVDYGRVPGTDKPTLFKAGAEKLAVLFQLDVQTTHDENWGPGEHLTVPAHSVVYHAPTGNRLGSGEGMCSTRERKYAVRKQERVCPKCGASAIIKGKAEYGGGWVCWDKRGGCKAKFSDGDQAIESQSVGEVENPDLPDLWNTIIKMARKRAMVDAVLLVTGASALFTQDVAEEPPMDDRPVEEAYESSQATTAQAPADDNTGKRASEKQVKLIRGRAAAKPMANSTLVGAVCHVTGFPMPQNLTSQDDAHRWLEEMLPTMPSRRVDAVLALIEKASADA